MTDVLTRTSQTDEVSGRRAVPVDVEGLTVGVPDRDEPILGPIAVSYTHLTLPTKRIV